MIILALNTYSVSAGQVMVLHVVYMVALAGRDNGEFCRMRMLVPPLGSDLGACPVNFGVEEPPVGCR